MMAPVKGARVVVYGLSTEGYDLAKPMAAAGADVWIIDEATPSAVQLKPEVAQTYPDVHSLRTDEPLLSMVPIDTAVSRAQYLFFAPRLRAGRADPSDELVAKFKDATQSLPKKSSAVYCLPVKIGGNADLVSLLEHTTGYEAGRTISYYYYPLGGPGGPPMSVGMASAAAAADPAADPDSEPDGAPPPAGGGGGSAGAAVAPAADGVLSELLAAGDGKAREFLPLAPAESLHAIRVLSGFARLYSMLEVYRLARGKRAASDTPGGETIAAEHESLLVDDMFGGIYDLRLLHRSFDSPGTVTSQINSCLRGLANYTKHIVDTVRRIIRSYELKASRTRVVISWRFDPHIMRADKAEALSALASMLRDHILDVVAYNWFDAAAPPPVGSASGGIYQSDKTIILLACTAADLDDALEYGADRDMIVVKANAACETFDMLSRPAADRAGARKQAKGKKGSAHS